MASSRAAGKAFGNIAETVCSLEFLTDITLLEKTSAGKGGGRGPPSPFFYVNFNATLREGWEGRPKDCRHPSYQRGGGLCPRSLLDVPEH